MKNRSGLTLLEALVALALISMGALQAMAVLASARDAERRATARLEAAVLAEYIVTQVRLELIDVDELMGAAPQSFSAPFEEFTWSIAPDTAAWTIDVLRVTVESSLAREELLVAACRECAFSP